MWHKKPRGEMEKKIYNILMLVVALVMCGVGRVAAEPAYDDDDAGNQHPIKVSLLTFYPGDEIFEVFGHSEILVTKGSDSYYFYLLIVLQIIAFLTLKNNFLYFFVHYSF